MKVEHIHTFPFMERMMLSGWMGPFAMMGAAAAKRAEREQERNMKRAAEEKKNDV